MWTCKHCELQFADFSIAQKANHTRWCDANPQQFKKSPKTEKWFAAMAARKGKGTNQFTKAKELGLKAEVSEETRNKIREKNVGRKQTEETKAKIKKAALASNHRRLKKSTVKYVMTDGSTVVLDSTWELHLAKKLDEMNVKWTRPEPVRWTDENGDVRNYFPDFYIPSLDVYVDPKNPAAYASQEKKIKCLLEQFPNLVILVSIKEIDDFLSKI
jgi:hypothetical protein